MLFAIVGNITVVKMGIICIMCNACICVRVCVCMYDYDKLDLCHSLLVSSSPRSSNFDSQEA